jgi:hypothetical protein
MRDIIVEIMVEVVTILGIATKEVKRGRMSELLLDGVIILADTSYRKVLENADGKQRNRE